MFAGNHENMPCMLSCTLGRSSPNIHCVVCKQRLAIWPLVNYALCKGLVSRVLKLVGTLHFGVADANLTCPSGRATVVASPSHAPYPTPPPFRALPQLLQCQASQTGHYCGKSRIRNHPPPFPFPPRRCLDSHQMILQRIGQKPLVLHTRQCGYAAQTVVLS